MDFDEREQEIFIDNLIKEATATLKKASSIVVPDLKKIEKKILLSALEKQKKSISFKKVDINKGKNINDSIITIYYDSNHYSELTLGNSIMFGFETIDNKVVKEMKYEDYCESLSYIWTKGLLTPDERTSILLLIRNEYYMQKLNE